MRTHFVLALLLITSLRAPGAIFADWTSADFNTNTASGVLDSVGMTLVTDKAVAGPADIGNGGIFGAHLDQSSTRFSSSSFSPSIAQTDALILSTASEFRVSFSTPVNDPVLHLAELGPNTLSFFSGANAAAFILLSSDGDFAVTPTTIRGAPVGASPDDANGSLLFPGTFAELRWTSDAAVNSDGMWLQISTIPEPSAVLLFGAGLLGQALRRQRKGCQTDAPIVPLGGG